MVENILHKLLKCQPVAAEVSYLEANVIIGNRYNRHELLQFANEIEGHPDNVAPAIYGGFTINTVTDGHVECFSLMPKLER